jgi:hypothetical protein
LVFKSVFIFFTLVVLPSKVKQKNTNPKQKTLEFFAPRPVRPVRPARPVSPARPVNGGSAAVPLLTLTAGNPHLSFYPGIAIVGAVIGEYCLTLQGLKVSVLSFL